MLENSKAFSGFAAPDIAKENKFYSETLGFELATKLLVLAPDNDNNRRTASFAGGVDDSANKAFASKWNQLLRLTEARRPSLRMS